MRWSTTEHALRRVAELVDVGRDRVHTIDPEVPRWHRRGRASRRTAARTRPCMRRRDSSRRRWWPSAAIAGMSSTTPCGYWGAEPTTSTCSSVTSSAIASTSAVQSSRDRRVRIGMSYMCADLWNAACADSATTISPAWMPRSARPRSRAASTAHWIDSVPPLVRKPAAVSGPCSNRAVHRRPRSGSSAATGTP